LRSIAHGALEAWPDNRFEPVEACPFCLSEDRSPEVDGVEDWFFRCVPGSFAFQRCKACASLWQDRRLTADALPDAYASYYTHQPVQSGAERGPKALLRRLYARQRFSGSKAIDAAIGATLFRMLAGNRTEFDARYRFAPPAPARLLDYGCGSGAYLALMQQAGYDVTGVDFDPAAIRNCRDAGIAALTPHEAEARDWGEAFDVITLSHVIEHVADPRALLGQLHGWLKPGGFIYVEAPNAEATGLRIFGRYWRGLEAPRHLAIPSADGLKRAMSEAGFRNCQQLMRHHLRPLVWEASLEVVPSVERESVMLSCNRAHGQNLRNAEYVSIAAIKG
jgi:2-polyprenyl-3-methyl-5-hydroxy-6-metoxy-1,4-benzoquinol methylase